MGEVVDVASSCHSPIGTIDSYRVVSWKVGHGAASEESQHITLISARSGEASDVSIADIPRASRRRGRDASVQKRSCAKCRNAF